MTRLGPDSLLAVLNVPPATPDFAGNYSCGPPSLQLASVTLHVLNGKQMHLAAISSQTLLNSPTTFIRKSRGRTYPVNILMQCQDPSSRLIPVT